jgi:hypothetical protein
LKLLLAILLLFSGQLYNQLIAQHKVLDVGYSPAAVNILLLEKDTLIIAGEKENENFKTEGFIISKITSTGKVVQSLTIDIKDSLSGDNEYYIPTYNVLSLVSDSIYFLTVRIDSKGNSFNTVYILDLNLEIQRSVQLPRSSFRPEYFTVNDSGNMVIGGLGGREIFEKDTPVTAILSNRFGEELWRLSYKSEVDTYYRSQASYAMPNGEMYVAAEFQETGAFRETDNLSVMVFKLDKNGKQVWKRKYLRSVMWKVTNCEYWDSTSFFMYNDIDNRTKVFCIDTTGAMLWQAELEIELSEIYHISRKNENLLVNGVHRIPNHDSSRHSLIYCFAEFDINGKLLNIKYICEAPTEVQNYVVSTNYPFYFISVVHRFDSKSNSIYGLGRIIMKYHPKGYSTLPYYIQLDSNFCFDATCSEDTACIGKLNVSVPEQTPPTLKRLSLYPMPANDKLTIESSTAFNQLTVYSITGQKLVEESFTTTNEFNLNITTLPAGMYILKTYSNSGFSESGLFSK